jgi:cytochrome c553
MKSITLLLCVGVLICLFVAPRLRGETMASARIQQDTRRTIWAGVYTKGQAARGGETYERSCSRCHGEDLSGGGDGEPPLAGLHFLSQWHGLSVLELVTRIRETEPYGAPGSLRTQDYVDVVSYILRMNGASPGENELPTNGEQLKQILIADRPPDGSPR